MSDGFEKMVLVGALLCCCSSSMIALAGGGAYKFLKTGGIEGTEDFYVKKYELDVLKKSLIEALTNGVIIEERRITHDETNLPLADFIKYEVANSAKFKAQDDRILAKQPYIKPILKWCVKHSTNYNAFRRDTETKAILRVSGTKITPAELHATYFSEVSSEAMKLWKDMCKHRDRYEPKIDPVDTATGGRRK